MNRPFCGVVVLALAALCGAPLAAQLQLGAPFGDRMVLQRDAEAKLWGRAAVGSSVTVEADWALPQSREKSVAQARAGKDGRFEVTLPTGAAGGPYRVVVRAGAEQVELRDVLLGEVWICSGQSNMEWPVAAAAEAQRVRDGADWPRIRLLQVPNVTSPDPRDGFEAEWQVCTPDSVSGFSAVGYAFGRALHEALDVPIGLVQSDWGGTPAESWTPADAFGEFPEFAATLARHRAIATMPAAEREARHLAELADWRRKVEAADPGLPGPRTPVAWWSAGLVTDDWKQLAVPSNWQDPELAGFDGVVWMRKVVEVPADWAGHDLRLELGPIDDEDVTWFGGEEVGRTSGWQTERRYVVPGRLVRGGKTVIAVRVHDTGGGGGLHGRPEQLRLSRADGKGEPLALAGTWRARIAVAQRDLPPAPRGPQVGPGEPSSLWNGMMAPLVPLRVRGAIWYQGESNVGRAAQYERLFPTMIEAWRAQFRPGAEPEEFPFLYVQIAPYRYGGDVGQAAALRDAQRKTLDLCAGTGMAVTMDVGNPADIHPRQKEVVGRRLALWALARTYGVAGLDYSGPLFREATREGAAMRVRFEHTAGRLLAIGGGALTCFQLAGEDRVFHPAVAVIEGDELLVSSDQVAAPVAVRFAFGAADEPNLANAVGLPASSFRSDDWQL